MNQVLQTIENAIVRQHSTGDPNANEFLVQWNGTRDSFIQCLDLIDLTTVPVVLFYALTIVKSRISSEYYLITAPLSERILHSLSQRFKAPIQYPDNISTALVNCYASLCVHFPDALRVIGEILKPEYLCLFWALYLENFESRNSSSEDKVPTAHISPMVLPPDFNYPAIIQLLAQSPLSPHWMHLYVLVQELIEPQEELFPLNEKFSQGAMVPDMLPLVIKSADNFLGSYDDGNPTEDSRYIEVYIAIIANAANSVLESQNENLIVSSIELWKNIMDTGYDFYRHESRHQFSLIIMQQYVQALTAIIPLASEDEDILSSLKDLINTSGEMFYYMCLSGALSDPSWKFSDVIISFLNVIVMALTQFCDFDDEPILGRANLTKFADTNENDPIFAYFLQKVNEGVPGIYPLLAYSVPRIQQALCPIACEILLHSPEFPEYGMYILPYALKFEKAPEKQDEIVNFVFQYFQNNPSVLVSRVIHVISSAYPKPMIVQPIVAWVSSISSDIGIHLITSLFRLLVHPEMAQFSELIHQTVFNVVAGWIKAGIEGGEETFDMQIDQVIRLVNFMSLNPKEQTLPNGETKTIQPTDAKKLLVQGVFGSIMGALSNVIFMPQQLVQTRIADLFIHCLSNGWLPVIDPSIIPTYLEQILGICLVSKHFELIEKLVIEFNMPLSPTIIQFLLNVRTLEDCTLQVSLIVFLQKLFRNNPQQFFSVFPFNFILSLLDNIPDQVIETIIELLTEIFSHPESAGFVQGAVTVLLRGMFSHFRKRSVEKANELFVKVLRKGYCNIAQICSVLITVVQLGPDIMNMFSQRLQSACSANDEAYNIELIQLDIQTFRMIAASKSAGVQ